MGAKKAASSGNLLQTIAHILGVNDISQLNPDANLGDLGLDSLMGVEIKQALERDYDIVLSMKDIRTVSIFNPEPAHLLFLITECNDKSYFGSDSKSLFVCMIIWTNRSSVFELQAALYFLSEVGQNFQKHIFS